ncbi:MAG: hypothetical protein ACRDS1_16750 [Pseudonocardiaceae bacterium]
MSGLRDYEQWHRRYDDPTSDLSWRLRAVQGYLRQALDRYPGQIRILSCCSGDGRDVLEVLDQRSDAERVRAVFVEAHPVIAERARRSAAAVAAHVEVRTADAGVTDTYLGAVPAEVVLLVGILGNISDTDLARTIATAPALCRPAATLLWSRARAGGDLNDMVRARFTAAGFTELDYATWDSDTWPAVGVVRYDGPPTPLPTGIQLFTFLR